MLGSLKEFFLVASLFILVKSEYSWVPFESTIPEDAFLIKENPQDRTGLYFVQANFRNSECGTLGFTIKTAEELMSMNCRGSPVIGASPKILCSNRPESLGWTNVKAGDILKDGVQLEDGKIVARTPNRIYGYQELSDKSFVSYQDRRVVEWQRVPEYLYDSDLLTFKKNTFGKLLQAAEGRSRSSSCLAQLRTYVDLAKTYLFTVIGKFVDPIADAISGDDHDDDHDDLKELKKRFIRKRRSN